MDMNSLLPMMLAMRGQQGGGMPGGMGGQPPMAGMPPGPAGQSPAGQAAGGAMAAGANPQMDMLKQAMLAKAMGGQQFQAPQQAGMPMPHPGGY